MGRRFKAPKKKNYPGSPKNKLPLNTIKWAGAREGLPVRRALGLTSRQQRGLGPRCIVIFFPEHCPSFQRPGTGRTSIQRKGRPSRILSFGFSPLGRKYSRKKTKMGFRGPLPGFGPGQNFEEIWESRRTEGREKKSRDFFPGGEESGQGADHCLSFEQRPSNMACSRGACVPLEIPRVAPCFWLDGHQYWGCPRRLRKVLRPFSRARIQPFKRFQYAGNP
ncbi:hypothetical protein GWK47_016304 [Chionoecetes opilio]|uniref:Uncharacterized protein n=1 Tax=Chionoecetes opilio TaxID=41210 RepID=A0A8J4XRZ5_CHIOP|nr:hypothetical protein GWK47_016304 [Chionoecetes opilio]